MNELDDAWRVGAHTSSDRFRGSLRSGDTGDRALPDGGVRGVLVGAARQVKQPYAGTALYSLAEDKRATREQERELKRLTLALCRPDVNNIARIAAIQLAGQRGYAEILPAEIGLPSLLVVQKTTPADFRHPFPLALRRTLWYNFLITTKGKDTRDEEIRLQDLRIRLRSGEQQRRRVRGPSRRLDLPHVRGRQGPVRGNVILLRQQNNKSIRQSASRPATDG